MKEVFTPEIVQSILQGEIDRQRAKIFKNSTDNPFGIQTITIPLDTAQLATKPYKIGFPFKSVFVQTATDTTVSVRLRPNTQDQFQSPLVLTLKDSWVSSDILSGGFLDWDAQAGKSITIQFFVDSEFRSGSQISQTSGGISISDGSSISGPTRVTLLATTATIIAPALSTRKKCTLQNKTGADLYIGGATIGAVGGATEGIKIPSDGIIYWQNTGALYGWSVAGGNVHYLEES